MQNLSFLNSVLKENKNLVTLIITHPKQLKESAGYALGYFAAMGEFLGLIAAGTPPKELLLSIPANALKNFYVINCFDREENEKKDGLFFCAPSDLTGIQVSLEEIQKKNPQPKTIIIDSLNMLGVYNSSQDLGKFLHLFTNKIQLSQNSAIIFATKDSLDEEVLRIAKEFASKTYDFTDMLLSTI